MKRRLWHVLIGAALIALFSGSFAPRLQALPTASAEWTLADQALLKPVPPELKTWRGTASAMRAWRATYRGTPAMTLTLYEMPRWPGGAFDALQQWRPQPGKMAFMKGTYFGVAESPDANQGVLTRFVHGIATAIPGRDETVRQVRRPGN